MGFLTLLIMSAGLFSAAMWTSSATERVEDETDPTSDEDAPTETEDTSILDTAIELNGTFLERLEVRTGDEDDVLVGSAISDSVFAEGGEDSITLQSDHSLIDGGDGDDQIDVNDAYDTTISGGNGDDVIEVDGPRNFAFGGAGDDLIVYDAGALKFEVQSADGGAGDDTLVSSVGIDRLNGTYPVAPQNFMTLTGGEGADRFELVIEDFDPDVRFANNNYGIGVVISDFQPGLDQLAVSFENPAGFSRVELEPYSRQDNIGTLAIFYFESADGSFERGVAVDLPNATGMTLQDVELVAA